MQNKKYIYIFSFWVKYLSLSLSHEKKKVDGAAQHVIEQMVLSEFPAHSFLGEEAVAPGAAASTKALAASLSQGHKS